MNKDVIYIEPEDDITDIISKLENAKEKIVALVPPKKSNILRSLINLKLLVKSATAAEKVVVLVTADPSILKLAASTRILVTKSLDTPPTIPKSTDVTPSAETAKATLVEVKSGVETIETEPAPTKRSIKINDPATEDAETDAFEDPDEKSSQKDDRPNPKSTSSKNLKSRVLTWLQDHKKLAILSSAAGVALIIFLIWATFIAPSVKINVSVKTNSNNFSENITFTDKLEEEDAETGKFYLEEKKIETPSKVEFTATGTKNVGEKATGSVIVSAHFKDAGSINIPAGTIFIYNSLVFISSETSSVGWDQVSLDNCENKNSPNITKGCLVSTRIKVSAKDPGSNYNIAAAKTGWKNNLGLTAYSDASMTGGTDKNITIIQQSDIDKAKANLATGNETESRKALLESIGDNNLIIESSFTQSHSDPTPSPAIGEEVKDGVVPALSSTLTSSIFVVDKTKIEEFIKAKARISDEQKIYRLGDPFIENFLKTDKSYAGKLKTSYSSGPKVTEEDILEKSKGKKIGEVQSILKSINGINTVSIEKSFFWVSAVPADSNKITINLTVEE